jgi:phosphohistidine phosphatase
MDLLVIRHADAEDRSAGMADEDRALTEKGHEQARRLGRFLARSGPLPTRIVTSPLRRALQTAAGVDEVLITGAVVEDAALSCGMAPEEACDLLAHECQAESCVALVGHEPDLSRLCAYLLGLPDADLIKMKKATVAHFLLDAPASKGGQLRALVPSALQE